MPNVLRVGFVDAAGGTIIGSLAPTVLVNGHPIAVVGAAVASHGLSPHNNATMSGHSGSVSAGGRGVCRAGDAATCGHTGTPGSADVAAGG